MRAVCWYGEQDVRVEQVPDPRLLNPQDIIVRVSSTAICGSDLHLYDGLLPSMREGDILGHEFMGEVVEVGLEVRSLRRGDRVVVPFNIACGRCLFCEQTQWSLCDNSNPNAWMAEKAFGHAPAASFGFSHLYGGYAGGQAEYVRVPYGDVGPLKVPDGLSDDKILPLADVLPTGWQAAQVCVRPGAVVAVWGCGAVGLMAMKSAWLLGAERVIGIDRVPERLRAARDHCGAETLDDEESDVLEALREMTGGRGPDACIDAVGTETHGSSPEARIVRLAVRACRKGGTVSIPGFYGRAVDQFPLDTAFAKQLTLKMGQTNVHNHLRPLFDRIEHGQIDPSFVITHRLRLQDAPEAYRTFREKADGCIKVVMRP